MMRPILKDSTDQSVILRVVDSTDGTPETGVAYNTAGVDLWYRREGGLRVAITEATLAAVNSAHSDGGFIHISDGYCRLDLPDAAVATGSNGVMVGGTFTGMVVIGCYVPLFDVNPYDSVRMGMTALPAAAADAAGGLPISDAGGLDMDSIKTDTAAILVDTGTTLQAELDGIQADTEDIQARLPAALVGGRIDATVDGTGMEAGATAAIADAVWDELQSGHVGAGTFGEVATEVASILVDTAEIGAAGAGLTEAGGTGDHLTAVPWNAAWDAEVQSEVQDAIEANNLDHLVGTATGIPAVPAGTFLDQIMDDGTAAYDRTTDSLQAIRDAGTTTAEVADAVWDEARAGHVAAGSFGEGVASVQGNLTGSVGSVTGAVGSVTGLTASNLDAAISSRSSHSAADVWSVATRVLTAGTNLNNLSAAEVLTQVNAAIDTAIAELGVAAPTATPTLRTGLMLLYMALRNKTTSTATTQTISNNAGTTIASAALSDDGDTFERAEMA